TPNDYEPPHFKASRNHKYQFITEPLKLDAGRYSNEWETVELKIETIYDLNKNTEIDTCKNDNIKTENKNINKEEIKCTCSINIEDLDMLQCDKCKNWLHTVCCGFFSNTDKRIPEGFYTCLLCTEKRKHNLIQHKQLSVYRRCLSIIYNENIHSLTWFARRIGISLPYAGIILKRLNDEGFVRKHKNKKEIKYEVVKNEESKERLKKYFCLKIKKETKSSITIKNIRCHSFY
ncbi:PHD-finger domain protein, partial [Spraguea lophii 42_110]